MIWNYCWNLLFLQTAWIRLGVHEILSHTKERNLCKRYVIIKIRTLQWLFILINSNMNEYVDVTSYLLPDIVF